MISYLLLVNLMTIYWLPRSETLDFRLYHTSYSPLALIRTFSPIRPTIFYHSLSSFGPHYHHHKLLSRTLIRQYVCNVSIIRDWVIAVTDAGQATHFHMVTKQLHYISSDDACNFWWWHRHHFQTISKSSIVVHLVFMNAVTPS